MPEAEIFRSLKEILNSEVARLTDRQKSILKYLVEEELAGRGKKISGYSIAIDVFKKPPDFDPQLNSTVRVELLRLRENIEKYHLHRKSIEGENETKVLIDFEKGSYRPKFTKHQTPTKKAFLNLPKRFPVWLSAGLVTILLGLFYYFGFHPKNQCEFVVPNVYIEDETQGKVANSKEFYHNLVNAIESYSLVRVVNGNALKCDSELVLTLKIEAVDEGSTDTIHAALHSNKESSHVWSHSFTYEANDNHSPESLVADKIGYMLGHQHYGVIPPYALGSRWNSKDAKQEYECIMEVYYIFGGLSQRPPEGAVAECLLQLTAEGSQFSRTWALLAAWYSLKQYRSWLSPEEVEDVDKWKKIYFDKSYRSLEKALKLDRTDPEAWIVKTRLLRFGTDIGETRRELETQLLFAETHLLPNVEVLRTMATINGLYLGNWEQAFALESRSLHVREQDLDANPIHYLQAYYDMLNGNRDSTEPYIETFLGSKYALHLVLVLVLNHKADQNPTLTARVKSALKKEGLDDEDSLIRTIKDFSFYHAIEEQMVAAIKANY